MRLIDGTHVIICQGGTKDTEREEGGIVFAHGYVSWG
jgi:hypothetical protein